MCRALRKEELKAIRMRDADIHEVNPTAGGNADGGRSRGNDARCVVST